MMRLLSKLIRPASNKVYYFSKNLIRITLYTPVHYQFKLCTQEINSCDSRHSENIEVVKIIKVSGYTKRFHCNFLSECFSLT